MTLEEKEKVFEEYNVLVFDNRIRYILKTGEDYVYSFLPLKKLQQFMASEEATFEVSDRFVNYPICINGKIYLECVKKETPKKSKKKG